MNFIYVKKEFEEPYVHMVRNMKHNDNYQIKNTNTLITEFNQCGLCFWALVIRVVKVASINDAK